MQGNLYKYLYLCKFHRHPMALTIVIVDKETDEYNRLLCFFFSFLVLHSCGRPELHQSSDRALEHGTEVGSGNTISPLSVRYDVSH